MAKKTSFGQFDTETRERLGLPTGKRPRQRSGGSSSSSSSGRKSSSRSSQPKAITRKGAGLAEKARAGALERRARNENALNAARRAAQFPAGED